MTKEKKGLRWEKVAKGRALYGSDHYGIAAVKEMVAGSTHILSHYTSLILIAIDQTNSELYELLVVGGYTKTKGAYDKSDIVIPLQGRPPEARVAELENTNGIPRPLWDQIESEVIVSYSPRKGIDRYGFDVFGTFPIEPTKRNGKETLILVRSRAIDNLFIANNREGDPRIAIDQTVFESRVNPLIEAFRERFKRILVDLGATPKHSQSPTFGLGVMAIRQFLLDQAAESMGRRGLSLPEAAMFFNTDSQRSVSVRFSPKQISILYPVPTIQRDEITHINGSVRAVSRTLDQGMGILRELSAAMNAPLNTAPIPERNVDFTVQTGPSVQALKKVQLAEPAKNPKGQEEESDGPEDWGADSGLADEPEERQLSKKFPKRLVCNLFSPDGTITIGSVQNPTVYELVPEPVIKVGVSILNLKTEVGEIISINPKTGMARIEFKGGSGIINTQVGVAAVTQGESYAVVRKIN